MRISTTMQYTSSLSYIQNGNSKVDDAANRYNKGTKFDTAGEDPSGMSSKIKYEGSIAAYKQYQEDGGLAANALSEEETALQSMWEALSSINTRLQQCVDGTNDDSSLKALAAEIENTRDHLYDLMNTQNTEGEYIFTGAQSDIPTYTLTTDGHYKCQADGSTRSVLVSPSVTIQVSDSGLDIFENCKTAKTFSTPTPAGSVPLKSAVISSYGDFEDLYEKYYSSATGANNELTLSVNAGKFELKDQNGNVIDEGEVNVKNNTIDVKGLEFTVEDPSIVCDYTVQLKKPDTDNILNVLTDIVATLRDDTKNQTDKTAAIAHAERCVGIAMTHYDSYRGEIGARQNNIETIVDSNTSLSTIKTESKASVSEVDAFEAASNLIQAQNQLTVSRQIYSNLAKQSLFDFI